MGQIEQIDIRSEILIEVASMAVLHCRQEMRELANDVYAVRQDMDEYRRLIHAMNIALDMLEVVGDFDSMLKRRISGYAGSPNDEITLVLKRREGEE